MKLIQTSTGETLTLPDDLLWEDEFNWSPTTSSHHYALDGTLIVEQASKRAGRPISLAAPANMAWVTREQIQQLQAWSALKNETYRLIFEYRSDTREFNVIFDHSSEAMTAKPVRGFPSHEPTDWFIMGLKLLEVSV